MPTVAIAAPGQDAVQPRIGLADAKPVLPLLLESGQSLRAEMREAADRIQAARRARLHREQREAFAALPGGVSQETLDAIGACESGGDPTAVSSDGSYRGKYQFDYGTWESVGGSGDPAAAPESEQDYRAALLYSQSGSSPWPVCG
jgi:Transglycosylase-like domain